MSMSMRYGPSCATPRANASRKLAALSAKHYSLFIPAIDVVLGEFGDELAAFKVEKATVRLPKGKPLPLELIGRVAVFVAGENAKAKTKS